MTVISSSPQVHQFDFRAKCIYLAVIIRKMLEAMLNREAVDDMVSIIPSISCMRVSWCVELPHTVISVEYYRNTHFVLNCID